MCCSRTRRLACWRNDRRFSSVCFIRECAFHPPDSSSSILPRNDRLAINRIPRGKKRRGRHHAVRNLLHRDKSEGRARDRLAPSMAHRTWHIHTLFLPYKANFTDIPTSICEIVEKEIERSSAGCKYKKRMRKPSTRVYRAGFRTDSKVVSNGDNNIIRKNRALNYC